MLADLFRNPDRFFRRKAEDDGLVRPALVVTLLGVVSALSGLPSAQLTAQVMPAEAQAFAGVAYVTTIVGGFIGAFIVWGIYAGLFHFIASYGFDGDGSFQGTAAVTAWGLVPAIVSTVIAGVLTWYAVQSLTVPSDPAQMQAFFAQFQNSQYLFLAGVLGIVFLLWQAFLWTFGIRHAHDLTMRQAAITVALPVAAALLLRLAGLLL